MKYIFKRSIIPSEESDVPLTDCKNYKMRFPRGCGDYDRGVKESHARARTHKHMQLDTRARANAWRICMLYPTVEITMEGN